MVAEDSTVAPPCSPVLKAAHERLGGSAIALQQVPRDQIGRYGMAVGKEVEPGVIRLEDMIEKPTPAQVRSTLATIGRYVLTPEIFDRLRATEPGKGGVYQSTVGIRILLQLDEIT